LQGFLIERGRKGDPDGIMLAPEGTQLLQSCQIVFGGTHKQNFHGCCLLFETIEA
jgi:hypothetical protein